MTTTKDYLLSQIAKLTDECAKAIDEAGEEMADDVKAAVETKFGRIEELKVEVKRIEDREAMKAQLEALGTVSDVASANTEGIEAKTPGAAVIRSNAYQALIEQSKREGRVPRFDNLVIEMKAAGDPVLESDGTNADAVGPNFDPTLRTPGNVQYPLRVADLLTVSQVSGGPTITYPVVTVRTPPSGNPTAEGAAKKGVVFGFDVETATLVKNTAFSGVSDEFFQDAPRLVSWINQQMGVMVLADEEAAIVAALYAAAGAGVDGTGIGGTAGSFDAIREAMATIAIAGGVPNAVLINPLDAANLDVQRAIAGDGDYFSGGPFRGPRDSVWGNVSYVESTAVDQGSPIVGSFAAGATLYRKGGLRVESSNSHDDYFERDLVALRAEIRSVAAVHYPEWFVVADLGTS